MSSDMAPLTSLGHQQLTVSTTGIGLTLPTTTVNGVTKSHRVRHALIQCGATNAVRWRADGTDPTASAGIALAASTALDFTDPMGDYFGIISQIKFIRSGGADATLDIEYFT